MDTGKVDGLELGDGVGHDMMCYPLSEGNENDERDADTDMERYGESPAGLRERPERRDGKDVGHKGISGFEEGDSDGNCHDSS